MLLQAHCVAIYGHSYPTLHYISVAIQTTPLSSRCKLRVHVFTPATVACEHRDRPHVRIKACHGYSICNHGMAATRSPSPPFAYSTRTRRMQHSYIVPASHT